jgi:hypothetical protein
MLNETPEFELVTFYVGPPPSPFRRESLTQASCKIIRKLNIGLNQSYEFFSKRINFPPLDRVRPLAEGDQGGGQVGLCAKTVW